MNVMFHSIGIFCENDDAGPVNIQGELVLVQPFESTLYSTFDGFRFGASLDERPITLAAGDLLFCFAHLPLTLRPGDNIEVRGNVLGDSSLTITTDELVDIKRPKTFQMHFKKGSQTVRAQFEVEKTSA